MYNVLFFSHFLLPQKIKLRRKRVKTVTENIANNFNMRTHGKSEVEIAKRIRKKLCALYAY